MSVKIALAGNPNSGKTTLFNELTGSSQYVGNWPGVTVEKKEGKLRGNKNVLIQDLPGIYSLSPYSAEEIVTRNYLIKERPQAILNIVDASNIERNLYLSTQLAETGIPMVLALNMMDIVKKNGDVIDREKIKRALGCEVVEISAVSGKGAAEAAEKAIQAASAASFGAKHRFSPPVEKALAAIEKPIEDKAGCLRRFYAVKMFERDPEILSEIGKESAAALRAEEIIAECETEMDDDSESIITNERYLWIGDLVEKAVKKGKRNASSVSDRIDRIVTNRILALPIFALVISLVYFLAVSTVGAWMTDWVNETLFGSLVPQAIGSFLTYIGSAPLMNSLILDGIVAGVGAVLGFLPQMLVLFLCLSLLEDCGYMARVAFIMDRMFRKFGLSGKSFIPILIGTGCGVPGIMASRTIENEKDRKITVITTTFIPCAAKLPIIALIAGALFSGAAWIAPSAYFAGLAAIVLSGLILKKTGYFAGEPAPFVMELPAYHLPAAKNVLMQMWSRGKSFVKKAGTIILLASVGVWTLSTFSRTLRPTDPETSMLAELGRLLAPLFAPLGWGEWKPVVATLTGLIAKENVVGTFGVLYGFEEAAENGAQLRPVLGAAFTMLSAYSFLLFNLLSAPCAAAIGAAHRELGSAKWTAFAVAYQTGFAYAASLILYQTGRFVSGNGFTAGTAAALLAAAAILWLILRKPAAEKPYAAPAKAVA